ncbi:MAG: DUF1993 domain-containing protein [Sandaracinobacteroides sp.]
MPVSLHDALVPNFRQQIGALIALIDKAQGWAAEKGIPEAEVIGHCLAPDMLPLPFQIKSVAGHSMGAIEGVRAGSYSPDLNPAPTDFAGLKGLLADADAGLAALDPAELEGFIGRDMLFQMRDLKMPFTAETFLFSFSQPNFYFHAATAYDILRNKGLPLGKRDFLGMPRIRM